MFNKQISSTYSVLLLLLMVSATFALPPGWSNRDIGDATGGSATETAGTWTIKASGHDIWGDADGFHFVYIPVSGDCTITARVQSLAAPSPYAINDWAKAGVMIRETLDPGSKFSDVIVSAANGVRFQERNASNTSATSDTPVATPDQLAASAPLWVRLKRVDSSTFYGYYSTDGTNWTEMVWGPRTIDMARNVYVGLAVTAHTDGGPANDDFVQAVFDNVTIELRKTASQPDPPDGALLNQTWATLGWSPGAGAVSHDVYIGTDYDQVNATRNHLLLADRRT